MDLAIKQIKRLIGNYEYWVRSFSPYFKEQKESSNKRLKELQDTYDQLKSVLANVEKSESNCAIPVVINCKATTHELKTWIPYYKAVVGGVKQFEVRKDDRNFKEGDILHLREWDNTLKEYTGRDTKMGIRYILKGGAFGVKKGYVIMGLCCL